MVARRLRCLALTLALGIPALSGNAEDRYPSRPWPGCSTYSPNELLRKESNAPKQAALGVDQTDLKAASALLHR
jgi:hypothetical protein